MTDPHLPPTFVPPSLGELAPHFPGFEITSLIATGGMGAVYHAIQLSLNREVAIKVLPTALSTNAEFRSSFQAEARSMARLNHPNLITIYDFGTAGGMLYIIMEYVKGESLYQAARGIKVDPSQAVDIVLGLAEGLAHAHKAGLVHRDVKPANILLNVEAVPQIGDFGLAARSGNGALSMGTPDYLAPEVIAQPDLADKRADIYSTGVILFELLTAKLPREGAATPSAYVNVNADLDRICATSLQPNPTARYQRIEDFITDLKAWRTAKNSPSKAATRTMNLTAPAQQRKIPAVSVTRPEPKDSKMALKLVIIICLLAAIFLVYHVKSIREEQLAKHEPDKIKFQPVDHTQKKTLPTVIPSINSEDSNVDPFSMEENNLDPITSANTSDSNIKQLVEEDRQDGNTQATDSEPSSADISAAELQEMEDKRAWEKDAKRSERLTMPVVAVDAVNGRFHESVKQELDRKNIRYKLLTAPITKNQLEQASVLVISGPFRGDLEKPKVGITDHRVYTNDEIKTISTFVRDGGVLIGAGVAWPWASEAYGNKKIEHYPLNQIGRYLDFRLLDGYAKFYEHDEKFTKIVGVAKPPTNSTFSNVEISGDSDKLILSSPNNTYCGLSAKRYFGHIYIFGHESPLQLNPELVSEVFFGTFPEVVRKEMAAMDLKFKNDLAELEKPLNALLNQYMEQLHLDKVQYQQAGNLDAALAHEQEIEQVRPKDTRKSPEWRAPEDPIIIKKRQEFMAKHSAMVSRNYDAAIALAREYAEQLNAMIVERTKAGKLLEAQAFQSRLDDLRTTMTIYRQMDKSVVEMSAWVRETLEWMPERSQSAGGSLPKLALARTKTIEEKKIQLTKDITMEFIWCPPGEFVMGSPKTEEGRYDDENQVNVKISKGFWMGKYEVTQEQWKVLMLSNPSRYIGDNLPVDSINWDNAQEFLKKLNAKIQTGSGVIVVLPTEAQWEYACRAGEKGPFSGGASNEVAWHRYNSGSITRRSGNTHQVGTKKPNAWGLYDMHGNVSELCSDWYEKKLSGGVNPTGPSHGTSRVCRGGSWDIDAIMCRASTRQTFSPTGKNQIIGFRVAVIVAP